MRYFASTVGACHTTIFSWSDFTVSKSYLETNAMLQSFFGDVVRGILPDPGERTVAEVREKAMKMAFFTSYSSKYANYSDWTSVRSWFSSLEPSEQAILVKARRWFQNGCRRNSQTWYLSTFGSLVLADLTTGAVAMATHVDHSDC
jgi:hypothetical protein